MKYLFHLANGMVLPPAMFFAWNYYRYHSREIAFKRLRLSMALFVLTAVVTGLQFFFPEIMPLLGRNREAIAAGEWWRLITCLLIQPMGIWQCLFNGLFFVSFVPLAEHLYGRLMLLPYFGASLLAQLAILYWETTPGGLTTAGGGSSTAIYAVMGSLLIYMIIHRNNFPSGYRLIPMAAFPGACLLLLFEDGHAPALLLGGLMGFFLLGYRKQGETTLSNR